jgi:uncharacterized alkaline shock family protein YloU
MSNIQDFWSNKKFYLNKEALMTGAREHFTEDFIANYTKWKQNLLELNESMHDYLVSVDFEMIYWYNLSYDNICKNINNHIEEWINANNNIELKDIDLIVQYVVDDHITEILENMNKKKYSIPSLLQSIKIIKF